MKTLQKQSQKRKKFLGYEKNYQKFMKVVKNIVKLSTFTPKFHKNPLNCHKNLQKTQKWPQNQENYRNSR